MEYEKHYVATLILATVACTGDMEDRASTSSASAYSSSHVEVTNNGTPLWDEEAAWGLEEDLRLGVAASDVSAEQQFGEVLSVTSDSRGMIYILDGMSQEIRVFRPDGAFSHTIGRRGLGPGEFSGARSLSIGRGDTLWVQDDGAGRYSVFSPDGTFLRSHTRRVRGLLPSSPGTMLNDGRYLDWATSSPDGPLGPRVVYHPILFTPASEHIDTLPPLEHTWEMLLSHRMPKWHYAGELSVAVDRRGKVWFARSDEYRIYNRTLDGDTLLVFTLPAMGAPIGDADRDYIRKEYAHLPSLLSEYLDALPETKPLIHRIRSDEAGHILVFAEVAGEAAGSVVDVFRDSGEYLGRLTLPTPAALASRLLPVVHVTADYLYILIVDELDVQYVSRLKIVRPMER